MNIDDLTLGQLKEIKTLTDTSGQQQSLNCMIGMKVIIRTYSAGVWFVELSQKSGREVVLINARRMWTWWAKESISLSACANHGVIHDKSKIISPVESVWLEAIEILPCSIDAINSLQDAPYVRPE